MAFEREEGLVTTQALSRIPKGPSWKLTRAQGKIEGHLGDNLTPAWIKVALYRVK